VDYYPNGGVAELVDEMIVGYEATAVLRELRSLDIRVGEIVELETEATSGFAEHIHNHLLLDQETSQRVLPFDPAS
jgi:hypothetical protein